MDMLHAMRTFTRVVECGSFAAAANALDISAAVSYTHLTLPTNREV